MRNWITLVENEQKSFYHGSDRDWEIGTVSRGRGADYHKDWSQTDFYSTLEKYRPSEMIAHSEAVFMCDNDDDIDSVGGATDWVLEMLPLGPVERHDINWSSAISAAVDDDADEDAIKEMAMNYWNGIASPDPLWEYLTREAKVIGSEPY